MLPLLLSLVINPAWACKGPTHQTSCHLEKLQEEDPPEPFGVQVRLGLEGTTLRDAPTTGIYGDLTGPRGTWLRVDGRVTTEERWMARISTGIDVLPDSPFMLRLGLFLGNAAVWQSPTYQSLSVGTDLAFGYEVGRTEGIVRFVGGRRPGGRGIWRETDVSLGYRVAGPLRVHGHWLSLDDGQGARNTGVGLGGSVSF